MSVKFTALGSAAEVGRSCHILETKNFKIMLDCGIKLGAKVDALPVFEKLFTADSSGKNKDGLIYLDFSKLDIVVLSHFHLDHSALLPFITSKIKYDKYKVIKPFSGKIIMTQPTKAVLSVQLEEFKKFTPVYDDFTHIMSQIETIGFYDRQKYLFKDETVEITAFPAGHVIGAAIFEIFITNGNAKNLKTVLDQDDEKRLSINSISKSQSNIINTEFKTLETYKIVYTGDFMFEGELHLPGAHKFLKKYSNMLMSEKNQLKELKMCERNKIKNILNSIQQPDLLIAESTFATVNRQSRLNKIAKFISLLIEHIDKSGIILLPCYALGRLHEIKMIIEKFLPVKYKEKCDFYYASNVMDQGLKIYERYADFLNPDICVKMKDLKPFKHEILSEYTCMKRKDAKDKNVNTLNHKSLVIFSSPGFISKGATKKIFQSIRHNENNLVILPGNCCSEIEQAEKNEEPLVQNSKCQIKSIGFSAHSDSNTMIKFFKALNPKNIALVHGHSQRMKKFKFLLCKEFINEPKKSDQNVLLQSRTTVVSKEDKATHSSDSTEKMSRNVDYNENDREESSDDLEKSSNESENNENDREESSDNLEKGSNESENNENDREESSDDLEKSSNESENNENNREESSDDLEKSSNESEKESLSAEIEISASLSNVKASKNEKGFQQKPEIHTGSFLENSSSESEKSDFSVPDENVKRLKSETILNQEGNEQLTDLYDVIESTSTMITPEINSSPIELKCKFNVHIPDIGQTIKIPPKKFLILHSKEKIKPGKIICQFRREQNSIFIEKMQPTNVEKTEK
ncbi:Integrator complex subunit 11 [Pseudoloma neurophilia]|uniref:Integrator complex subunit 11 n=1 Tax=Pseudoloma neurophilia TaxID=146866 RepID=A0A0R0M7S5_9MICR|nr:Integrator complex subunit 11 [Pseudoloma neurophilia]